MFRVRLIVQVKRGESEFIHSVLQANNYCLVSNIIKLTGDCKFAIDAQGHENQINNLVDWCNDNSCGIRLTEYILASNIK